MTITEKATEELRAALMRGEFAANKRLTEKAACEYLNISRTPVREALRILAQEGLLSYEPQRHYRIRQISAKDIMDAYQVRASLEGLACRLALRAGFEPEATEVMQSCVSLGEDLLARGEKSFDHNKWREMNVLLHKTILATAENETLTSALLHAEKVPLATLSVIADWAAIPDYSLLKMAQLDHHYIVQSLLSGDGARAEARMREHIIVAGDLVAEGVAASEEARKTS